MKLLNREDRVINIIEPRVPDENESITCHFQSSIPGSLICKAARLIGQDSTNEVNASICAECPAGKIYREIGCDSISPKIHVFRYHGGSDAEVEGLFCSKRSRETTLEYCKSCNIVVADTTRQIVNTARSLFERYEFYSAFKFLEKARKEMRDGDLDGVITSSIAIFESVMKSCHEKKGVLLPDSKQVTGLWKSTRKIFELDEAGRPDEITDLLNVLSGVVSGLGRLRNELGDAHGKGESLPVVTEMTAELSLNTAATLATAVIRIYAEPKEEKK
jgi:hypothetical protein